MNDIVIAHHGIKGQRWGVRRFQNEDGTRTAAGKRRAHEQGSFFDKVKRKTSKVASAVKEKAPDAIARVKEKVGDAGESEIISRGKAALDVLANGDTDWMGNHDYDDDAVEEMKKRGKAALERLLYSEEQIENKKFFGDYDF